MLPDDYRDDMLLGRLLFDIIGVAEIRVYGSEGDIEPHFHIINNTVDIAICIFENSYLPAHSNNVKSLTINDYNMLNKWLKKNVSNLPFTVNMTNWENICLTWDCCNDGDTDPNAPQPEYLIRELISN
jgi:hypothetical protein